MTSLPVIGNDESARFKSPLVRCERVVGETVIECRIGGDQMEFVRVVVDFPFLNIAGNVETGCRRHQKDCGQRPESRQEAFLHRIQIAIHLIQ